MIDDGITEKVSPSVTRRHGDADLASERDIKLYYIRHERHDWVARARWFERRRERRIMQLLRRDATDRPILDLGCGTGLLTRHLWDQVVGLDANLWALHRAQLHAPRANYVAADAEALPFRSAVFRTVIASEVFEHLPDLAAAVAECHRVLAIGGQVIGSVPHVNPIWFSAIRRRFTPLRQLEPLHRSFTISQVQAFLADFTAEQIAADTPRLAIYFHVRKLRQPGEVFAWNRFWQRQTLLRRSLRNMFNRLFKSLVLKQVRPTNPAGWVLDAGVGSGSCARLFAMTGFRMVGVDFSRVALSRARETKIELVRADVQVLPFRGAAFQFAYAQGLLEHPREHTHYLKELSRVASQVCFSVPMRFSLFHIGQLVFDWLGRPWLWPSEHYLTPHELRSLIRRHFSYWQVRRILVLDLLAIGSALPGKAG